MCSKGFNQAFPFAAFRKSPLGGFAMARSKLHGHILSHFHSPRCVCVCDFSGTSWKQLCTLRGAVYGCCMACRHKGDACGIVWCLWCIDIWQTIFSWCVYISLAQDVSRHAQISRTELYLWCSSATFLPSNNGYAASSHNPIRSSHS